MNDKPEENNSKTDSEVKPEEFQGQMPQGVPENVMIVGAILEYLKSEKGNESLQKVITFFQEWRGQAVRNAHHSLIINTIAQLLTLAGVLGVAVYVSVTGKMDPVVAGLLGTLAGFVLGRKNADK